MNLDLKNNSLKETILRYSFLLLALTVFVSCEQESVEDQLSLEEVELYGSDKDNAGSVGSSGGDDEDDDYN